MLSKENVATLPVILVLAEMTLFRQSAKQTFRRALTVAYFTVPAFLLYLVLTQVFHRNDSELVNGVLARLADHYNQSGRGFGTVVLTECRVFFSYAGMMLFPFFRHVEFMRAETLSKSLLDPTSTLPAVAGLLGLVILAIALMRKRPVISFGILFAVVSLMPESLMIPQYLFFGYRAILPMVGIMLVLGYGILVATDYLERRFHGRAVRRALVFAALIPVIGFAAITAEQARAWNHVSFWTTLVKRLPPYSSQVETVPFLDISVNCMSSLAYVERYPEVVDTFLKVLAAPNPSESRVSDSNNIDLAIGRFTRTFAGQTIEDCRGNDKPRGCIAGERSNQRRDPGL